jgi:sugar lactone lactonase YvrE
MFDDAVTVGRGGQEDEKAADGSKRKRRCFSWYCCWTIAAVLVVAGIAIGLGTYFGTASDTNNDASPAPSPTTSPSVSPSALPTASITASESPSPSATALPSSSPLETASQSPSAMPSSSGSPAPFMEVLTVFGGGGPALVDGFGTNAQFNGPTAMIGDSDGNWYVTEMFNRALRKVISSTGEVITVAGGPGLGLVNAIGTNAQFNSLMDLAFDPLDGTQGILYVADQGNHAIRAIDVSNYDVYTLAGTGSAGFLDTLGTTAAQFNYPFGIILDGAGNLFVSDEANNAIRKININSATVTTIAGSGVYGFVNGVGSAAQFYSPKCMVFHTSGILLITDTINNAIRSLDVTTGAVDTVAGGVAGSADGIGTNAQLTGPVGIAIDHKGNIFIAEQIGNRIRTMNNATYNVQWLAGSPADVSGLVDGAVADARFTNPNGLFVDNAGLLYVMDLNNHAIRRIRYHY